MHGRILQCPDLKNAVFNKVYFKILSPARPAARPGFLSTAGDLFKKNSKIINGLLNEKI